MSDFELSESGMSAVEVLEFEISSPDERFNIHFSVSDFDPFAKDDLTEKLYELLQKHIDQAFVEFTLYRAEVQA